MSLRGAAHGVIFPLAEMVKTASCKNNRGGIKESRIYKKRFLKKTAFCKLNAMVKNEVRSIDFGAVICIPCPGGKKDLTGIGVRQIDPEIIFFQFMPEKQEVTMLSINDLQ